MAKTEIDITAFSIQQLRELEEQAQQRIRQLEEESRQKALAKMEKAATEVGMTPFELLQYFGLAGRTPSKPKAAAAKYRNPQNPDETWAGRGRKPAWVEAWLAAGKDLAELATE